MLFVEQNIDAPVDNNRLNRFWFSCQAHGSPYCSYLPWNMTDSGFYTMNSYSPSFSSDSAAMIDSSLARAPGAAIQAQVQRVGNHYSFSIDVTNLSGVTLSSASNEARVFAMIYEEVAPSATNLTSRVVRAMVSSAISSLADQATGSFALDTSDLTGVVWENLYPAIIVDYRPGGAGAGWYDSLQAVFGHLLVFADSFESNDTTAWSSAVP